MEVGYFLAHKTFLRIISHLNCTTHKDETFPLRTLYIVVYIVCINLLYCILSFLMERYPHGIFAAGGGLCPHKKISVRVQDL